MKTISSAKIDEVIETKDGHKAILVGITKITKPIVYLLAFEDTKPNNVWHNDHQNKWYIDWSERSSKLDSYNYYLFAYENFEIKEEEKNNEQQM